VIGVRVRVKDRVQAINPFVDGLFAEIRRGVDKNVLTRVLDKDARSRALVVPVCGSANGAAASDGGNAHRGAGAEDCELCAHALVSMQHPALSDEH
jgi:hypothetical protein